MTTPDHARWMEHALQLARRGEGLTRPNPPVGAVVVRDGQIVGKGYHRRAGGPHAEVSALQKAGTQAKGATLYITLEPCSTQGRTPPCTEAIAAAGIRKVVWAINDPNPAHAGRATRWLRRRGIEVERGVGRDEAAALLQPFTHYCCTGRPWITLKLGITVDGRIADRNRHSRWITGPEAREEVQALRRRVDAVWIGSGTVRADNPSLWPRPAKGRQPWRVVQDGAGHSPPSAQVFTDAHAPHTFIALDRRASDRDRHAYQSCGAQIVDVPQDPVRAVKRVCAELAKRGALHVLCEGGGGLADTLIRAACVDEYWFFLAPKVMGGNDGIPAIGGRSRLMNALRELEFIEHRAVGRDLLIRACPRKAATRGGQEPMTGHETKEIT